jgi:hypothetical protein
MALASLPGVVGVGVVVGDSADDACDDAVGSGVVGGVVGGVVDGCCGGVVGWVGVVGVSGVANAAVMGMISLPAVAERNPCAGSCCVLRGASPRCACAPMASAHTSVEVSTMLLMFILIPFGTVVIPRKLGGSVPGCRRSATTRA